MKNKKKLITLAVALVLIIALSAIALSGCAIRDASNGDSLDIASQSGGQRFVTGILVAALGILVVFVLLIILISLVVLVRKLMEVSSKLSAKAAKQSEGAIDSAVDSGSPAAVAAQDVDDDEIAAVIAAVYAVISAETEVVEMSDLKFKVKSVKRLKSI